MQILFAVNFSRFSRSCEMFWHNMVPANVTEAGTKLSRHFYCLFQLIIITAQCLLRDLALSRKHISKFRKYWRALLL